MRVGLQADAVFTAQSTPTAIFKDAGDTVPSESDIRHWHQMAWNIGVAPVLWIITPTEVQLYNCYASPSQGGDAGSAVRPLDRFDLNADDRLQALDAMCGRLATETGAFWTSAIGQRIDRQYRVDRELLEEINALEQRLTALPPLKREAMLDGPGESAAARDFSQRLIGRCIFTWYLLDRGLAQQFLSAELQPDLSALFATPDSAFALFDWLRRTFNGDLFPMDDPGAERTRLGPQHLALIGDFIEGRSLVPENHGQGRLFRFRFDAIPVDLISSIYQQFARSSAEATARLQGLHYTPVELVHLTLDPVFEDLAGDARVIDPTCGSGAFLVEAFRRLVWKQCGDGTASRAVVRNILYRQLFGIDINASALGIAAFSLYLAALEFDDEPVLDVADLKFHRLVGTTLFEADTVGGELPAEVTDRPFDAVVGNPPWTFDKRQRAKPRKTKGAVVPRPRRSPDWAFLDVAATLAGDNGRLGMVMKASPFFSRDEHAIEARSALLTRVKPAALVNLSALRKEHLFPDATGPALLIFARCALMPSADQLLVGSMPWTPDFVRNGLFQVGPSELRTIPLRRILRTPAMLKAATFGTARDSWLVERLEREFPRLQDVLNALDVAPERRGQGYQVEGSPNMPPDHFYRLKVLSPSDYTPFHVDSETLPFFSEPTLHRVRNESIYCGPLLLCPKASFQSGAEEGRYSAARVDHDVLYTESFYGISFAEYGPEFAPILSGILNSCVTTFQLAYGGGAWGLERSTVEPKDLLSLRVPDLRNADPALLAKIVEAEAYAARDPVADRLELLDSAVADLYEFDRHELVLARESIERARMLIFEGRKRRRLFVRPPSREPLQAYAMTVASVVDGYLRTKGARHLQAAVYSAPLVGANWAEGGGGLTAVRFRMDAGAPPREPAIVLGEDAELVALAEQLKGWMKSDIPPYLNERRNLRLYLGDSLFMVKPSEVRYWTRSAGLNDADVILADHWLKSSHAAHA
ncbi:MAG TPA: N-6 DNA methylase [Phenylobacterium sp.]|jgi:hypothetical protein